MKKLSIILSLLCCSLYLTAQDTTAVNTETIPVVNTEIVPAVETPQQADTAKIQEQPEASAQQVDTAAAKEDENYVYVVVEDMPQFPGGVDSMHIFIAKNMNTVLFEKVTNNGQKAIVEFVVEPTGILSDVAVLRSSGIKAFDDEVVRVVALMPAWSPGYMGGVAVRTKIIIPIKLSLNKE